MTRAPAAREREVVQLRQPRRPFPIPDSMARVVEVFGSEFDPPWTPVGFTLQRSKEGTMIGLQHGRFWWNLSHMIGVYPASFKEARQWVNAYAAQHGQSVTEMRRVEHGPGWEFPPQSDGSGG
jgi:hypothetical protein